jgi:hypothetical protein
MSLLALPVLSILTDTRAIFLFLGLSYKTRKKNEPVLALPMFIPIQPSQTLLYSFTKPPSLVNFLKMTALGVNGLWSSQAHSFQLVGPNQTFTFTRSCVPETQNNNMHTYRSPNFWNGPSSIYTKSTFTSHPTLIPVTMYLLNVQI